MHPFVPKKNLTRVKISPYSKIYLSCSWTNLVYKCNCLSTISSYYVIDLIIKEKQRIKIKTIVFYYIQCIYLKEKTKKKKRIHYVIVSARLICSLALTRLLYCVVIPCSYSQPFCQLSYLDWYSPGTGGL